MVEHDEFMEVFEKFAEIRPLYMSLNEMKTGFPRWRIHVLERGTAPTGGDREIIFIEDQSKKECLRRGREALIKRVKPEGGELDAINTH